MLLFALCWLTLPSVFAPLERLLVGGACLVPRMWSACFGSPALAAGEEQRLQLMRLADELQRRVVRHDTEGARLRGGDRDLPVHCAVIAGGKRGGAGAPCELQLDHSYAELADCGELVTKGDALVGFLLQPGIGPAANDRSHDPARVALLNHPAARPLYAALATPDGGVLRLVVRAAANADPAALRVDLWDDPYRAARLDRSGLPVRTLDLPGDPYETPPGLLLGSSLVWGYPRRDDGQALTLGVFVTPPIDARALSHVVVWRDAAHPLAGAAAAAATNLRDRHRCSGTVYDLPGATQGRHLLLVDGAMPPDAAVVQDGRFLGTARGMAFGVGLVTSFVASRHRWSLLLLPDDPNAPPRELDAEVLAADRNVATLRWRAAPVGADAAMVAVSGQLFTGSNGWHCPAGLLIGHARPHPREPEWLEVTTEFAHGPRAVEVLGGGRP